MVKYLVWGHSFNWVFVKHFLDYFLGVFRYSSESHKTHVWVALLNQIESCFAIRWLKRKLTAYKSIVNDSWGPNIYLFTVSFLYQHFRSNVSWSSTTFHHQLVWCHNLWETKVCYLNHCNFFSSWILLNQDVLRLEVSVNYATYLKILDSIYDLIHDQRYLLFFKLICFDVLEQFTTFDLFHNNVHVLFSLIGFSHANHIWMRNQLNDLNLFSEKFTLSIGEGGLMDMFHSHNFLSLSVLTLVNCWELSLAKLSAFYVFVVKTQIVCFAFKAFYPVGDGLVITMVVGSWTDHRLFVGDAEAIALGSFLGLNLWDIEPSQRNNVCGNLLIFIIVDIKRTVSEYVVPRPHCACFLANF